MGDSEHIAKLIALASEDETLQEVQHAAARKELRAVDLVYPRDACAITQSCLLQAAGIDVADTYGALALGLAMEKRGWQRIAVGKQQPGDLGSTCKSEPDHGNDHIYLVLRTLNDDEMVVADNQSSRPHFRYASGKGGKTPSTHFLRAPASAQAKTAEVAKLAASVLPGKPTAPTASESALRRILDILQELVADAQKMGGPL